ncbi:hypothetical protein [Legionella sp. W05-934-2]|jgi:hypothetical protein|uniref:hypothetical protein n=1 Tax=Legionella sp. W05-934-2 TaxID=1198649 RepID=UPI003462B4D8
MQGNAPFSDWHSDPKNQSVAELMWLIKNTEAPLNSLLALKFEEAPYEALLKKLEYCTSLLHQLRHFYPPVDYSPKSEPTVSNDRQAIIQRWQQQSIAFKQSANREEKATCIAEMIDCLHKLTMIYQQHASSQQFSQKSETLPLESLSSWFLSFIDLIRHQQDNPAWATDFFHQLNTSAYQDLYQMLTHDDTAHLMFHVYYYKLFPDQLSQHSKHPDFLISLDHRLSFLYQRIEQFIETFISISKNLYHLAPKNFLCHGNQLPKGITLRSKETYRQLIMEGLKKLNSKVAITEQTPTAEIIDAIFRSYQFWFNPCRLLDAIFMLCKRLQLSIHQPLGTTLYSHMVNAFQSLEVDACINLYGYFSNNDTLYLLRVLYYISQGRKLSQLPTLSEAQCQLIDFFYQALMQVTDALSESLNARNLPCKAIEVDKTAKAPSPSKRNLQAILHIIATYCETAGTGPSLESLFAELEHDTREQR